MAVSIVCLYNDISFVMAPGSLCAPRHVETKQCIRLKQQRTAFNRQLLCTGRFVGIRSSALYNTIFIWSIHIYVHIIQFVRVDTITPTPP